MDNRLYKLCHNVCLSVEEMGKRKVVESCGCGFARSSKISNVCLHSLLLASAERFKIVLELVQVLQQGISYIPEFLRQIVYPMYLNSAEHVRDDTICVR